MARPSVDIDAMREQLLELCEDLVRERGAVSFTVSDLAHAANMSPSNLYRFFESKEAVWEAMAERWFRELNDVMEDIVASDLPVREKMFQFFARRLEIKRDRYEAEPDLFQSYMELGNEHFEVIRGYIDLADHYMAQIIGEAMADGYFDGLEIDDVVSLMNLMVQPFVHPDTTAKLWDHATAANLRLVINAILDGLVGVSDRPAERVNGPRLVTLAG